MTVNILYVKLDKTVCLPKYVTVIIGRAVYLTQREDSPFASVIPHFNKDCFGPKRTRSLFLVDRLHFCQNDRELADNHRQSPGKIWHDRVKSFESRVPKK